LPGSSKGEIRNDYAFAALKSDGTVVSWGYPNWGGTTPAGIGGVTQIFSTQYAFAALKSDGTVVSWGDASYGGTTPAGLGGVTQIFSTYFAFAALKSDGTVVSWGDPDLGGTTPAGRGGVTQIFSNSWAFAALQSDGTVVCWGDTINGGTTPEGLGGVTQIFSNGAAFAALKSDGTVVSWGNNYYRGTTPAGLSDVVGFANPYTDDRLLLHPTTPAPAAPRLTLASDTGSSNSDRLTNNGTITIGGLEAGASWQYSTNGGTTWSTDISATTTSFSVAAGSYATGQVQVRQTDAAGNSSPATTTFQAFTVDTSAPLIDGITVSASTVELSFNEALASPSSVLSRFNITIRGSNRSLTGVQSLKPDNSSLQLSLSGAAATAEQSFTLRYKDPTTGDDITGVLEDLTGNDLATFSSTPAVLTYRSNLSSTGPLANSYKNLILAGNGDIIGIGNSLNNNIIGNSGNNALNAGAGNDTLNGGDGNDKLFGIDGNDTLDGGLGDDTMIGGAGNDTFYVDSIGDFCLEASDQGIDTIISSVGQTLSGNFENLTLTGSANINAWGNSLNNFLIGNSGNNLLNGKGGIDTMIGGLGNDAYMVDNSADIINEEQNSGFDWVQSSINWILGDNLENLILTGTANLSGTGNALNNQIKGNIGDNILDGGQGRDNLTGEAGADIFRFSNSPSYGAGGADRILDFSGSSGDRLQISRPAFGITDASVSLINTNDSGLNNALKTNNLFVYNASNGYLYHNANGSTGSFGSGGVFAVLTNKPTQLMSDWVGLLS
jgi:Ca2+-binding RTX toxin-like protein